MQDTKVRTGTKDIYEDSGREASFFQVDDVRKMLGISRASAYSLVNQKGFPRIRIGNRIVIPCDLFNEWVTKAATSGRC